ncbi:MAG: membrane protein insertase YidC [Clostridia bacterium]|nr:membrane protein insertase YidC [Clostridia bacterium]
MNEFLKGILDGINSLFGNYGWSIIVFTVLIKLVLMPFDYKSRVGMRKTTKIQPQISALQKKYAKDQEKLNAKMAELYKKEGVNPLSSCLPLLLTFPILFAMFGAMRMVANEQLVQQAFDILLGNEPVLESWLWIKNLWMPDSPFASAWPDLNSLNMITADIWQKVITAMPAETLATLTATIEEATGVLVSYESFGTATQASVKAVYDAMAAMPSYVEHVSTLPGWNFNLILTTVSVMKDFNGWFLLPLLSAVSQFFMSNMTQPAANTQQTDQQKSTSNFMKWFFPIFTLWLCFSYTAAFALYWVASNLIAMAQNWGINKYLDAKEKKAADAQAQGTVK